MKILFTLLVCLTGFCLQVHSQQNVQTLKGKKVLVFTKNGKGYVHENIPASIAAIQKLAIQFNFTADTTTSSAWFTDDVLKQYDAIIFSNTNNDVFDTEEQRVALMRYMQAGGGFIGIHSASGTERNWKWFKLMLGATFLRHPPFQPLSIHVLDTTHPAINKLSLIWQTKDECYYFKEFNPSIKVLAFTDLSKVKEADDGKNVKPDLFGNRYPCIWCHVFDGGRVWYTSLGHNKDDYSDPAYLAHIIEGLKWVADKPKPDYRKAIATTSFIDELNVR